MIIKNLSVQFKDEKYTKNALIDFSLTVQPGTFLTMIGKSGCGKSTLLHTIAKLCPSASGTIEFPQLNQPKIGMIFQEPRLMSWLGRLCKQIPKSAFRRYEAACFYR